MSPGGTRLLAGGSRPTEPCTTCTSEGAPGVVALTAPGDAATPPRTPSPISRESRSRGRDVRLFGPFRLDVVEQRLWRGNEELKLRRKLFAILRFLTANPQRLATQEEVVE